MSASQRLLKPPWPSTENCPVLAEGEIVVAKRMRCLGVRMRVGTAVLGNADKKEVRVADELGVRVLARRIAYLAGAKASRRLPGMRLPNR